MTSSSFSTNNLRITLTKADDGSAGGSAGGSTVGSTDGCTDGSVGGVSPVVDSIAGDESVLAMVVESMFSVVGPSVSAIVGLVGSSGSRVDLETDVSWMT